MTPVRAELFLFGPLGEEPEQEPVDLLRGVELHPVRGALDALVAPGAGDELAGRDHPVLGQVVVAAAPEAERVGGDLRERRGPVAGPPPGQGAAGAVWAPGGGAA